MMIYTHVAEKSAGARSLLEVVDQIEERGADFRSLVEGLRTDTAHGRMTFQIFERSPSSSAN